MRCASFTGPKNPTKHGTNAKVAKSTRVCPPTICYSQKPGNRRNFEKKRSRSEKAILGATLGIPGHSRSDSRNGTHDLIYVKTLFSEQLSERLSELVGHQDFSPNSQSFFFKIGVVPAPGTL